MRIGTLVGSFLLAAVLAVPTLRWADAKKSGTTYEQTGIRTVNLLSTSRFGEVEKMFDDNMAQKLPPGRLADVWKTVVGQSGSFKKVLRTQSAEAQGFQVVMVTCAFERQTLIIQIAFDKEQKIGGLFFRPA